MLARPAGEVQGLIGWRSLTNQDAVFHDPICVIGETPNGWIVESVALLAVQAARTRTLAFMLGRAMVRDQSAPPKLLIYGEAQPIEVNQRPSPDLLKKRSVDARVLTNANGDAVWISATRPFRTDYELRQSGETIYALASIEADGGVRIEDIGRDGSKVYADWGNAFVDAIQDGSKDSSPCASVLQLASKSIS